MTAHRLIIEEKTRPYPIALVGPDHFRSSDGGPVDPRTVLTRPEFSLYCVDHERRRAIFVETPTALDLSASPFYYQAQYDSARSLVAISYDTMHELADQVRGEARRLILIYSVGRCGSTLVNRAFAEVAGVVTRSEPDVFTQLLSLREAGLCGRDELSQLVRSCMQLTCRDNATHVIKFRSFAIELADVFAQHYPEARVVFLYRNAIAWTRSSLRAFGAYDPAIANNQASVQDRLGRMIPLLAKYRARQGRLLSPVEVLACHWVSQMECALALRRAGVPMHATRYEDLTARPREGLAEMFAYCGLPAASAESLNRILAEDSQAGSSLSRAALGEPGGDADPEEAYEPAVAELKRVIVDLSSSVTPDLVIPNRAAQ